MGPNGPSNVGSMLVDKRVPSKIESPVCPIDTLKRQLSWVPYHRPSSSWVTCTHSIICFWSAHPNNISDLEPEKDPGNLSSMPLASFAWRADERGEKENRPRQSESRPGPRRNPKREDLALLKGSGTDMEKTHACTKSHGTKWTTKMDTPWVNGHVAYEAMGKWDDSTDPGKMCHRPTQPTGRYVKCGFLNARLGLLG